MKLTEKQKVVAVAAFFFVVVAGVSGLNYLKFSARSELIGQIDRLSSEERSAQEKIKRIPGLLEERAELRSTVDKYAEILPAEQHVQHDAFVEIIDGYRQDTDIVIQKADYVKSRNNKGADSTGEESFIRHRYRFSLFGTVPDFIDFVNKIENHTRFLKVDSIKIKPFVTNDGVSIEGGSEAKELYYASRSRKEIELTISTYTYKGSSGSKQS